MLGTGTQFNENKIIVCGGFGILSADAATNWWSGRKDITTLDNSWRVLNGLNSRRKCMLFII